MDKPEQLAQDDITQQRYQGNSATVGGFGDAVLKGKILLFGGFALGALSAAFYPAEAKQFINQANKRIEGWRESRNIVANFGGMVVGQLIGFGRELAGLIGKLGNFLHIRAEHIDATKFGRKDGVSRLEAAVEGGILASAITSLFGGLFGGTSGAIHAMRGKKQFNRAKEEIITLRDTNDMLREKLVETQSELEDARTAKAAHKGSLKVASDEPPVLDKPSTKVNEPQLEQTLGLGDTAQARA